MSPGGPRLTRCNSGSERVSSPVASRSPGRHLVPAGIMAVQDLKRGVAMAVLSGRVALVTGASAGIGAGLAAMLAAGGATGVWAGRGGRELGGVADGIRQRGGVAIPVVTDLTSDESIARLLA